VKAGESSVFWEGEGTVMALGPGPVFEDIVEVVWRPFLLVLARVGELIRRQDRDADTTKRNDPMDEG
jgi:hypothetical protein